ncbi:MAG: flagellar basal-body MS-ring/collar protein FliF, partial [Bdellovibrionota bacterium]
MSEFLKKVFGQVQEFFGALTPGKRIAAGVTLVGVVGGVIGMMMWAGQSTFQSLMQNLGPEDAANVIRILREKKIPFTVDPTGRNVSVPPEKVYDLRLELATLGLPQSGIVGYEVFDKQNLGTTSFVQKVNQKRALEGELIRTINTMRGVKRSRVHLALPAKSAFIEDQKKATASVVLDLEAGVVLNEKQVYGIGNLVGRAVEGLDINDVVIMNSD